MNSDEELKPIVETEEDTTEPTTPDIPETPDDTDEEPTTPSGLCDGAYARPANQIVDQITSDECANIKANTGLDGTKKDNCDDLASMVCDIKQEVDWLSSERSIVLAPNEASKCNTSEDPTLASIMSRILRFAQTASCILCAYDPYVATILKSGKYPQILMGSVQEGGYPQWVNPDDLPTLDSKNPVTSEGVQTAIKQALLGVFHPWAEYPKFQFFAQTLSDADDPYNLDEQSKTTTPAEGDTALIANDGTHENALYTYTGGKWVFSKVLTEDDGLTNFVVTNVEKGYYETKDVYYFLDGTTGTWQVMDADLSELQERVTELEKIFQNSVLGGGEEEQYIITTRPDLTSANAVACDDDRETLVFITG